MADFVMPVRFFAISNIFSTVRSAKGLPGR